MQHPHFDIVVKGDAEKQRLDFQIGTPANFIFSTPLRPITDQRCSTRKKKTHKCFWSAWWHVVPEGKDSDCIHSRCNLHNDYDKQTLRDELNAEASKFPLSCMLIVFVHGS